MLSAKKRQSCSVSRSSETGGKWKWKRVRERVRELHTEPRGGATLRGGGVWRLRRLAGAALRHSGGGLGCNSAGEREPHLERRKGRKAGGRPRENPAVRQPMSARPLNASRCVAPLNPAKAAERQEGKAPCRPVCCPSLVDGTPPGGFSPSCRRNCHVGQRSLDNCWKLLCTAVSVGLSCQGFWNYYSTRSQNTHILET